MAKFASRPPTTRSSPPNFAAETVDGEIADWSTSSRRQERVNVLLLSERESLNGFAVQLVGSGTSTIKPDTVLATGLKNRTIKRRLKVEFQGQPAKSRPTSMYQDIMCPIQAKYQYCRFANLR